MPLDVFITDKAYLNNPPLSEVQYDAVRHLEQIYLPETYPEMVEEWGEAWEPVRQINFAWIQWGKGSGKDHICRVAAARVAYLLLCLKSPQAYFSMPQQDDIHTLNVAASATQAHRAFFRPLKTLVQTSPCFKGQFEPREYSIRFAKQIEAVSGHSMAETMEGLNIILGVADEISAFKTNEEVERYIRISGGREPSKTAETILKMIRTSARTRFPRNFKLAAISYPRFKGDAIQQLTQRGRDDNQRYGESSRIYVSGPLATWEVNPRVRSRDEFREDYEEDPGMARAMYECLPETSVNRFFRNDAAVFAAFEERRQEPLTIEYYWGKDETSGDEVPGAPPEQEGWQVRFHYAPDLYPLQGAAYIIHGDMAVNGDRAGVAMAHVRNWKMAEWEGVGGSAVVEPRPIVRVDFVTSFESELRDNPPREIQIRWFRKLVFELSARGFYIAMASFDNFQSTDTMQILESRGIPTQRLSTDRNATAWNTLRDVMYDGRLEAYWRPLVVNELLSLMRLANGKVDHPTGGSKDEADAVAGAVMGAVLQGGTEGEEPQRADQEAMDWFTVGSSEGGESVGPPEDLVGQYQKDGEGLRIGGLPDW